MAIYPDEGQNLAPWVENLKMLVGLYFKFNIKCKPTPLTPGIRKLNFGRSFPTQEKYPHVKIHICLTCIFFTCFTNV